ncbi:MAG: Gx transporter family protein [Ruminococcaceae bacterium]|nr:Gx transporter family protein [Oscillospiraceae bacterium]
MKKINKIALLGMTVAAAMILSYVESFISFGVPGLKVGLPNIVIVFLIYKLGWGEAAAVSFVRCVLTSLLFGSVMSLAYSLAGAALSITVMAVLKKWDKFSSVGVSIAGGITHNAGQIIVAILVTGVEEIAYYMPVLAVGGTVAGLVIGVAGALVLKRLEKVKIG